MTPEAFKLSLSAIQPTAGMNEHLQALWYDAKGQWETAHNIIQDITDRQAEWIHAYLHRKEGDSWNADYWYNRAGRMRPSCSLEEEWTTILQDLLGK